MCLLDSNECEEANNDCFDDSLCTDTFEGFECRCPDGFADVNGDGRICIGRSHQWQKITDGVLKSIHRDMLRG